MIELMPTTLPREAEDIYLARQPIVDCGRQLHGFELLFRQGLDNQAKVIDRQAATSSVILRTLSEFGMESVLGSLPGFINCDADFLMSDAILLLPADKVVLEIRESIAATAEVQRRCLQLKAAGFRLALDDFQGANEINRPLLFIADMIKVDIAQLGPSRLDTVAREVRTLNAIRIAEKVETPAQFVHCRQQGFHLFQGYHFARPEMVAGRRLAPSHGVLMQLLAMLRRDADIRELGELFKHHPALAVDLLRLANSAALGAGQTLRSIANAIMLLGRRQLERWVLLMMLAGVDREHGSRPALLHLGATRGKLMELLMQWQPGSEHAAAADSAFIVGIVSVMDALLGQDMESVATALGLAPELRAALLEHAGPLGNALRLAQALEGEGGGAVASFIDERGGRAPDMLNLLNRFQGQAMAWANRVLLAA